MNLEWASYYGGNELSYELYVVGVVKLKLALA